MIYVTGGICGNYNAYKKLIRTINLKKRDDLYIIGDIIGPFGESFALLEDMSMRENVFPVLGRNEFAALKCIKKISDDEGKLKNEQSMTSDQPEWLVKLIENFRLVDADTRAFIIEYLSEIPLFEELTVGGREYLLVNDINSSFKIDIPTDGKTVISERTLKSGFAENTDGGRVCALCLDTGENYRI